MSIFLSTILDKIKPSPTLAVTNKAAKLKADGHNVISLGAGEPDFDTPDNIKQAAINAIHMGKTKYTAVDGTRELKMAICQKFARENNIKYTPEQITVGSGAKHVIFNAFMATINAGDEVIIPAPYWVSYPDMVILAGGVPVTIPCPSSDHFKLKARTLRPKMNSKTKWLIINSPNNPTGAVYSREELREILEVVKEYPNVYILTDDIYEHIIYDEVQFYTAAQVMPELADRIFTVNGVAKAYAMTGWRIGYGGGPAQLIKAIQTIQSQSTSNPCSISQEAAIEALSGTQHFIKPNAKLFQDRRDFVVAELNRIDGLECATPPGAFYAFPSCEKLIGARSPQGKIINNDLDFAEYLLEQNLVAVVPGSAFGMPNFFRISYATSLEELEIACNRIAQGCTALV